MNQIHLKPMKSFSRKAFVPLVLLVVMLIAYGLQLRRLGFYWDDWVFVYRYRVEGILNTIFYGKIRQYGAYAMAPGFLLAGSSVLGWHIYSLLLRWALALAMRWNLRLLWPKRGWQADLMALLFAIYPAFKQHSMAVTYSMHYMVYLWYFLSMGLMILANRSRKYFWLLSGLALVTQAMHMFGFEYFFGLEWLRLLVLWRVLNGAFLPLDKKQIQQCLLRYLPYFIVAVIYVLWRSGALSGIPFQTYGNKTFFSALAADPAQAVISLVGGGVRDLLYVLVTSWYQTLNIDIFNLAEVFGFSAFLLAAAAMAVIGWLWHKQLDKETENKGQDGVGEALFFGAAALLLGFLPTWYAGLEISSGKYSDRFSLAALYGASILLVAGIEWLTGREKRRTLAVVMVLAALAAGYQARLTNTFRWDWTNQKQAYWNLYWRAPSIEPDTTLISNGNISQHVDGYVMIFAINELYQTQPEGSSLPLWVDRYSTSPIPNKIRQFKEENRTYKRASGSYEVEVRYPNTLAVYYDYGQCLVVLDERDAFNKSISSQFRKAAYISRLDRIQTGSPGVTPVALIFGEEPSKSWCYYYEKAELAAQENDWAQVVDIKQQTEEAGAFSDIPAEYVVFIKTYAILGEWQKAADLTLQAYALDPSIAKSHFCSEWNSFGALTQDSAGYQKMLPGIYEELGCQ